MENLYEVVRIKGKGLGCRALQDIKSGTLILREKFQCVAHSPEEIAAASSFENRGRISFKMNEFTASLFDAYLSMSKKEQQEFLKLDNMFRDYNSPVYDTKPDAGGDCKSFLLGTPYGRFIMYDDHIKTTDILQQKVYIPFK